MIVIHIFSLVAGPDILKESLPECAVEKGLCKQKLLAMAVGCEVMSFLNVNFIHVKSCSFF